MRKRLLLALLTVAVVLVGCGDDDDDTSAGGSATTAATSTPSTFAAGSTMDSLQKKGKIVIGTKFDQPLFGLKGLSGQPEGFDVEIAAPEQFFSAPESHRAQDFLSKILAH